VDYASYLGGPGDDFATGVAAGPTGDMFVAGIAGSFFPTLATSFAPQADHGGFVARIDGTTGQFIYSTYIPGVSLDDLISFPAIALQIDGSQNAYVAGGAEFVFPTTPGAFQTDVHNGARTAFVLKLDPTGSKLVFSTLLGGSSDEFATGLTLTGDSVTIAGDGNSFDFPATDHSMNVCNASAIPAEYYTPYSTFVASFDHTGKLLTSAEYSDCRDERIFAIGGTAQDLRVSLGSDYGYSFELDTMDLTASNAVQIYAVVESAAFTIGPAAPLQLISIFGTGLGPRVGLAAKASGGVIPTSLGGTTVRVDGVAAPLLYVSDGQVNAVIPASTPRGYGNVVVSETSGQSASFDTWVVNATPTIFSRDGTGIRQGAILNQDGTINSASNAAARGSIVSIFATGGGLTSPAYADGQIAPAAAPLAGAQYVVAQMDGMAAKVLYAGAAPDLVNGVVQINAQVPTTIAPGPSVPVLIVDYPYTSQGGLTIAVK
jgi:uncharacterized protein (TIGR03437 family)